MTPEILSTIHRSAFVTDRPWSTAEFKSLLISPHTHLTAKQHGFALWRCIADEAELLTIAVNPKHQHKGIGRDLMSAWMTAALNSAKMAFLEVAADNRAATALYREFGFVTVGRREKYYARQNGHSDALIMQAALGSD